jgi:hypothetical protein
MPEEAFARFRRLQGITAPAVEVAPLPAMTPVALLHMLHVRGVHLRPMGTHVDVEDPAGVVTDDVRQALVTHQAVLLGLVEELEERLAIAHYCGGLSIEEAERLAWQCALKGHEHDSWH